MEIIDNINQLLGENLKQTLNEGVKLKIADSCFSIYAFEALKDELEKIDSLEFVFTSPTFIPNEVTDKIKKERREFHIPKLERERSFYGSEFETDINEDFVKELATRKPLRVVFRDSGFENDSVKINIEQIFKLMSPSTDVKVI